MATREEALDYHRKGRPGKTEVVPTKPCLTQHDLSLAYTPGVAIPCLDIEKNQEDAYLYTNKGNLVAVVSNGTAVLGLGDIGAIAGKPVMEGKGVLFKRFADVDVFDIEVNTHDPDEVIKVVQLLEPTFGGINLEDIKAPECFYIEETLKKTMNIPVFHDDQHGTAIISGAGLMNAVELVKKDLSKIKVVFCGAGAAGMACADLYLALGVKLENILFVDTKGVIYKGRTEGMNPYKAKFAVDTKLRTLEDAMKGADVFVGVSAKDQVTPAMVKSMANDPIIFAMANPDPEITYSAAKAARSDVIMATGRSDYPNQVNNVLGFPFIFRGALDVRATAINMEMKIAASHALARLAKEDVPDDVAQAYGVEGFKFGREYIIPKPFDPRVLIWEASAVAEAAMKTGVAKKPIDIEQYKMQLEARLGKSREVVRTMIQKAARHPKRIVFAEGENDKIMRAARIVKTEQIGTPILLGRHSIIQESAKRMEMDLNGIEIIDPKTFPKTDEFAQKLFEKRQRKGVTLNEARFRMNNDYYLACMMVETGYADAMIAGMESHYPDAIKPALSIIGLNKKMHKAAALYIMIAKNNLYFLADAAVNLSINARDLAEIALMSADVARRLNVEPKVALLSLSNFGSVKHPGVEKVQEALAILREMDPKLVVDGEMQANVALDSNNLNKNFPFSMLKEPANVLVFPDMQSCNIAYKLLNKIGKVERIGPILMGMRKSVHILERECSVREVVNLAAMAALDAHEVAEK